MTNPDDTPLTRHDALEAEEAAKRSTQGRYPWRAAVRTAVAVLVGGLGAVSVAVPVIVDMLGDYLGPQVAAWLLWLVGLTTAVSLAITRIMALEPVLGFTARWLPWLAPEPKK